MIWFRSANVSRCNLNLAGSSTQEGEWKERDSTMSSDGRAGGLDGVADTSANHRDKQEICANMRDSIAVPPAPPSTPSTSEWAQLWTLMEVVRRPPWRANSPTRQTWTWLGITCLSRPEFLTIKA